MIIIAATILNIFVDNCAQKCPIIPNNQNHLAKEIKTIPRDGPLTSASAKLPIESKAEASKIVENLPDKEMLSSLLKKRSQWASMMMQIVNAWAEKTSNIVEKLYGIED